MRRLGLFLWDTRHLTAVLALVLAVGGGFAYLRGEMVPETFGEYGHYRGAALEDLAAQPTVLVSDAVCIKCHEDIGDERAEALHVSVRCVHCHGPSQTHLAAAERAKEADDAEVPPAAKWDGNFLTQQDFYIAKDRATCLVCHESVVGMPKDFQQIIVADHLDEQGAEEPESREVCFECHGPHDTAP